MAPGAPGCPGRLAWVWTWCWSWVLWLWVPSGWEPGPVSRPEPGGPLLGPCPREEPPPDLEAPDWMDGRCTGEGRVMKQQLEKQLAHQR